MALYASIPFMMAHNTKNSVGLFWLNAAEGWIDVKKGGQGWFSGGDHQVDTFWMFESGIVDLFVMLGPGPRDVSRQYGALTGNTALPPEFSIAYHQCRSICFLCGLKDLGTINFEVSFTGGITMTKRT